MLTTSGDRVALFITPMKIRAQPIQYWQHYVRPHSDTHSYDLIIDGVIIIFLAANQNSQSCAEMLSPRGQSGLEAKIFASASVSASKLWPRHRPWPQTFGLGLASVCSRRTSSQDEIDWPICLNFTLLTTGHHSMLEDSYCARERMRN